MAQGFESLQVWQAAHELRVAVHRRVVPCLPPEERFDLIQQIRRASKSIGANIAEGYGRFYWMDNVRFCYNARGSLAETLDHLIVARDLGYIDSTLYQEIRSAADRAFRLLNGYIAYLKQRRFGADEPGANVPTITPPSTLTPDASHSPNDPTP
jgi:four helix bundle protein